MSTLLLRADAGRAIGTGHAMRSLAFTEAWALTGAHAVLLMAGPPQAVPNALTEQLRVAGAVLETRNCAAGSADDVAWTLQRADDLGADWVSLDGYHFGPEFQRAIRLSNRRLLVIDDYGHLPRYDADIVLNQNIDAAETFYPRRNEDAELLLGTRYALLRRQFTRHAKPRRRFDTPHRVLVTMGGSDPRDVTSKVLLALESLEARGLDAIVVIGGSNEKRAALESQGARMNKVRFCTNANDMPALMEWADLAIGAGGSTCWELAYMALPAIIVVAAENQVGIAKGLHAAGAAINLGWHEDVSSTLLAGAIDALLADVGHLRRMSAATSMMVDGLGAERVAARMRHRSTAG